MGIRLLLYTIILLLAHFRCVPVCGPHLLGGSALYVHVHGDSNLPVHTEEAEAKRLALASIYSVSNTILSLSYLKRVNWVALDYIKI